MRGKKGVHTLIVDLQASKPVFFNQYAMANCYVVNGPAMKPEETNSSKGGKTDVSEKMSQVLSGSTSK